MGDAADDLYFREIAESLPYNNGWNRFGYDDGTKYPAKKQFVWTTRDGQKLQPKDMETSHIKNCIRQLKSQIIDPWTIHGDEPKYGAGGYMDSVLHDQNEKLERSISIFEAELNHREERR